MLNLKAFAFWIYTKEVDNVMKRTNAMHKSRIYGQKSRLIGGVPR